MKNQTSLQVRAQRKFADSMSYTQTKPIAKQYFDFVVDSTPNMSFAEKGIHAGILNNFQKIMDSDLGSQITTSSDFGPYVQEIWPVVTAWYPEFPLKDLISVQDMDKPLAYLFFSRLLTGTNKAGTTVGEVVETATGKRILKGHYPTGEIIGEALVAADFEFDGESSSETYRFSISYLAYFPLNLTGDYLSKVKLTVTSSNSAVTGVYTPLAVLAGKITLQRNGSGADSGSYIEIATGGVYIYEGGSASASTITAVSANYVWVLDYANERNMPSVKEDIEFLPMEVIPRGLKMEWTLFSEYLKKAQFGVDIREDNTKRILNLLYHYQLRYILDSLYEYATGTSVDVYIPATQSMSVEMKAQYVTEQLKIVATTIEVESGRQEGNRIVCGKNFKSFVESLPSTLFTPTPQPEGFAAPREIGKYGTFVVYYDQQRGDDEAFMTYRGSEWYDASYYMGVFLPIVPTDAIALGVTVRESFVSMEAYKFHKPQCVIPLKLKVGTPA